MVEAGGGGTPAAAATQALSCSVKAFHKDGVRVCWAGAAAGTALAVEYGSTEEGEWRPLCTLAEAPAEGVQVVKAVPGEALRPRDLFWRVARGGAASAAAALARAPAAVATAVSIVEVAAEAAFNVCQRYGTVIYDARPEPERAACRILESLPVAPGEAPPLARSWKDTALLVGRGWTDAQLRAIAARVVGDLCLLPELADFAGRFPFLCATAASTAEEAARRLPVLPNLVEPGLYLGHQGHALSLDRYRDTLGITHVVNLAEDRVASAVEGVVYLRSSSGLQLRDVPGEGEALLRLLDELLPPLDAALRGGGAALAHCQQGRSRSCSLVAAFLARFRGLSVRRAVERVAHCRPELEINEDYLRALLSAEAPPSCSVEELLEEHPRWVRRAGVARDHLERPAPGPQAGPRLWQRAWAPVACGPEGPSFASAAEEDRLAIAEASGYGTTLLEIMKGLRTDYILDNLLLGSMADAAYLPFLQHHRVTHILSCAAEVQPPPYEDAGLFSYFCLSWRDSANQGRVVQKADFAELRRATAFLHQALAAGVAMVHCVQGISRSASVVVAYLQEYQGLSMEEAVSSVRKAHPGALQPFPFQEMLVAFHYHLQGSRGASSGPAPAS